VILEIDILTMDLTGGIQHIGTFKAEVKDDQFGYTYPSRCTYTEARALINNGAVIFRPITRPKNRSVNEDD
jgi:hypothetical protein